MDEKTKNTIPGALTLLTIERHLYCTGIKLQTYDMLSLYQPDGITFLEYNGNGYIITANEGDSLELETAGQMWTDVKRGRQLVEGEFYIFGQEIGGLEHQFR